MDSSSGAISMGSPGAGKPHTGQYGERTPSRQRGGAGSACPLPTIFKETYGDNRVCGCSARAKQSVGKGGTKGSKLVGPAHAFEGQLRSPYFNGFLGVVPGRNVLLFQ